MARVVLVDKVDIWSRCVLLAVATLTDASVNEGFELGSLPTQTSFQSLLLASLIPCQYKKLDNYSKMYISYFIM
jgi:hypothetical protein